MRAVLVLVNGHRGRLYVWCSMIIVREMGNHLANFGAVMMYVLLASATALCHTHHDNPPQTTAKIFRPRKNKEGGQGRSIEHLSSLARTVKWKTCKTDLTNS